MKLSIAATTLALAACASAMTITPLMARADAIPCVDQATVGDRFHVGQGNTKDACDKVMAECGKHPHNGTSCMGSPDAKVITASCLVQEDEDAFDYTRNVVGIVNKMMPPDQQLGLLIDRDPKVDKCPTLPGVDGDKCAQYNFVTEPRKICPVPGGPTCIPKERATEQFFAKAAGDWVGQCRQFKEKCDALPKDGPVLANNCDPDVSKTPKLVSAVCIAKQNGIESSFTKLLASQLDLGLAVGKKADCQEEVPGSGRCALWHFSNRVAPICHI